MQSPTRTLEPSRSTSILLRGGVILQHDSGGSVTGRKADVLISGDRITQIHPKISPPSDETTIINCHDKLISPGFIDTHRHMWQTQLKGRHGNHNLAEYIPTGHLTGGLYSPEDVFLGELGAAAESIDAGTTTVVDHAHVALSPPHVLRAIDGLVASGLRAFFCLVPTIQAESWKPVVKLKDTLIPDWFLPLLENLAEQMPMADGRIKLGLGFDGFHLPREEVVGLYQQAKKHGIKLFTSHHCRGPIGTYFPYNLCIPIHL
jgi:cytosine/adenosine deaminase-related metal-dependent hydrolase